MKPICVKCQRFYRIERNGTPFVENMPTSPAVPAGTERPDLWTAYKLWLGDLWKCEGCGSQIIVGTGADPVAEHFEPDFAFMRNLHGAEIQVNDC